MKKLIIILIIFSSCRTEKVVTEYQDRIIKDTIYTTKTIKEIERFTDTLTIESPCDSLGNLKPFNQLIKVKQGNIKLTGVNNVISAEIDLNGYKNTLERTYERKYKKFVSEYNNEKVIYKTPFWHWLAHIIAGLLIFIILKIRYF